MGEGMNIPNILTMSRFLMTGGFVYFAFASGVTNALWALGIFVMACLTDAVDGYIARRYHQITAFGSLMDPIADKWLTLTAFFVFAYQGFFPFWAVFLIAIREVVVTVVRLYATTKGDVLPAEKSGKIKTVVQMSSLFAVLLYKVLFALYGTTDVFISYDIYLRTGLFYFIIVALLLTFYSGISFFIAYVHKIKIKFFEKRI